jgi:chromosome segregation ATPase
MLSRLLHIGVDRRLERAAWRMAELETLRSRVAEIESSLAARAEAERVLLRRLADYHVRFELARQRLGVLTEQASDDARSLQRERDRADSAERRLAEMTSGRAELHAELEREHALRVIAEQTVQRHEVRHAQMEERLRRLTEAVELAVSTLSKRLEARREVVEQMVPSITHLVERLKLLSERAAPRRAPAREDQHLRFYMTGSGYELTVGEGPPPRMNTVVDRAEHGSGVVTKLGPSPLPADSRCCAYVLPCTNSSE